MGLITWMQNYQLAVLLETQFVQPRPLSYSVVRRGRSQVGLLEAEWNGWPVHYHVNLTTMLPERIEIKGIPLVREGQAYDCSDYVSVDGIPVPTRVTLTYGNVLRAKYTWKTTFNVKYRNEVFKRRPSADYTRDTWHAMPGTSAKPLRTDR
ncbi:MAG: hypothetical protein ACM3ZB_14545 [bacterium]|jgi:hypothetical protein